MDSRAKQRLTGAVILVALFVWLVPKLLTGAGSDAQRPEAAGEAGLRRYTIDIDHAATTARPAEPDASAEVSLPAVVPDPTNDARAAPGESAAPAPDPHLPANAPLNHAVEVTPSAAASPPATAASASPPAPRPEAARAQLPHTQDAPPATTVARDGGFAVQLGTFEKRENADRLVRDMTAKGFAAFVAPITKDGRELYRVRVGPTRDRAAAEALAAQLKRVGQAGSVVAIS